MMSLAQTNVPATLFLLFTEYIKWYRCSFIFFCKMISSSWLFDWSVTSYCSELTREGHCVSEIVYSKQVIWSQLSMKHSIVDQSKSMQNKSKSYCRTFSNWSKLHLYWYWFKCLKKEHKMSTLMFLLLICVQERSAKIEANGRMR